MLKVILGPSPSVGNLCQVFAPLEKINALLGFHFTGVKLSLVEPIYVPTCFTG